MYSMYHGFGQAKSAFGGSILGQSQFPQLLQLPQKMKFASLGVKSDSKIIVPYHSYKPSKHTVLVV